MAERLVELIRELRVALVAFRPETVSAQDCAVLVEELAATEKASAAARVRAAVRAGEAGVHRERGFADVSDWLARATGGSAGSAKAALETAAALDEQPAVKAAVEAGALSLAQARELVEAEAGCPGSGVELLDVARHQSLKALKDEVRERRARAIDPEELHALQCRTRHFRHWRTRFGAVGFAGELPPEIGVPIINRLEAETDRCWQAARKKNEGDEALERRAALAADAFVRLVETGGKGKARSADLVIVCDLRAYRRGRAHAGEPCHIVGGGPLPVSLARDLGRDAFVKAVLHDGVEIHTIAHLGRKMPAVLRTALELGSPPEFDGITCSAPGCDRRYHLEQDHHDPVANGGVTSYRNVGPLCWPHHRMKTEQDRTAGLLHRARGPDPP
ncbi:MAG TPA: HNH endonuclease signature motif containing protein [Acidimicrobiia bacterium]|nr:HNH endonuclease signature motif containing protein [Acidimicrobiia bacterium]